MASFEDVATRATAQVRMAFPRWGLGPHRGQAVDRSGRGPSRTSSSTPDEEEFLGQLRGELEIPEPLANALLPEGVQRARQRFFSRSAARSSLFLTSREAPLQLVGASQSSIEGAVHGALEQACRAVPRLHWVGVSRIRGEVVDGRVHKWQVELEAWLDPEP